MLLKTNSNVHFSIKEVPWKDRNVLRLVHTEKSLDYQELKGREVGGLMLSINRLHNFYYLPELHDMRCKVQRICKIIRGDTTG